eukprot:5663506-Heterocapsa_arctica.AAC.1
MCSSAADTLGGASVEEARVQTRMWRRGYFKNKRWDKNIPSHGKPFTLLKRWELQQDSVPDNASEAHQTPWERKAAKRVMWLARRRARQL